MEREPCQSAFTKKRREKERKKNKNQTGTQCSYKKSTYTRAHVLDPIELSSKYIEPRWLVGRHSMRVSQLETRLHRVCARDKCVYVSVDRGKCRSAAGRKGGRRTSLAQRRRPGRGCLHAKYDSVAFASLYISNVFK